MSDWQPIATAPKDGTEALLWDGDRMMVCWWGCTNLWQRTPHAWVYGESSGEYNDRNEFWCPTHWMPLPDPPQA